MSAPSSDQTTVPSLPASQGVRLVARREFVETVRSRSYVVGTIITMVSVVIGVAAFTILPALFGGDDAIRLGALPAAGDLVEALPPQIGEDVLEVTTYDGRDAATAALEAEEVEAVLASNREVLVVSRLSFELQTVLQSSASLAGLADVTGRPLAEVARAAATALEVSLLEPVDEASQQRRTMVLVGVFFALAQVLGGAFMVAYGVTEEKSSRVVEVVLARIRPRALLAGKVVGLGAANFVQLVVLAVAALTAVAISPDLDIPPGLFGATGAILGWFVLAYAIYASLFSIAGALTARQEDMQQRVLPFMYLLFVVFAITFFAFDDPESQLTRIASLVPLTGPTVMPLRDALVGVALVEQLLAVVVTLAGAALAVWLAGSVYSGGALRLRGRTTFRQALRERERGPDRADPALQRS